MTTTFPFTISTDFPYQKVASDRLRKEILDNPGILTALADVATGNGVCTVVFRADLSAAEEAVLHGDTSPPAVGSIIGDHSGEPLEDPAPVKIDNAPSVHIRKPSGLVNGRVYGFSVNFCDKTTWWHDARDT